MQLCVLFIHCNSTFLRDISNCHGVAFWSLANAGGFSLEVLTIFFSFFFFLLFSSGSKMLCLLDASKVDDALALVTDLSDCLEDRTLEVTLHELSTIGTRVCGSAIHRRTGRGGGGGLQPPQNFG